MRPYTIASALLICLQVALVSSCDKGSSKKNAEYAKLTNPLWALAPADTALGVVVGDSTGTQLHKALVTLVNAVQNRPGGGEIVQKMRDSIAHELPVDLLDARSFAKYGIDVARGAALFVTRDSGAVVILPVGNRETLLKALDGTTKDGLDRFHDDDNGGCKEISGRYVCAKDLADLDKIGKSDVMAKRMASQTRGHIEVWADLPALDVNDRKLGEYFTDTGVATGAMQLEPGGFTVRGVLAARPRDDRLKVLIAAPHGLAQAAAKDQPAGMFRLALPILGTLVPVDDVAKELAPVGALGGIDVRKDLIDNLTGELLMYSPAGDNAEFVIKIGLRDAAKLDPLIKGACALGAVQAPQYGIKLDGKRCRVDLDLAQLAKAIPDADAAQLSGRVRIEAYTDGNALVARARPEGTGKNGAVQYTDLAREITGGSWNVALWGQGISVSSETAQALDETKVIPGLYEALTTVLWAAAHLSETGLAVGLRNDGVHAVLHVGTQFANPDDVLAEFEKILDRILAGDAGAMADLEKLARKSPKSMLGRSWSAGQGGLSGLSGSTTRLITSLAAPGFRAYSERAQAVPEVVEPPGEAVEDSPPGEAVEDSPPGEAVEDSPPGGDSTPGAGKDDLE